MGGKEVIIFPLDMSGLLRKRSNIAQANTLVVCSGREVWSGVNVTEKVLCVESE